MPKTDHARWADDLAHALNRYAGFSPWTDVILGHPAVDHRLAGSHVIRGTQAETYRVPCRGGLVVARATFTDRWRVVTPA